jgi:diaminopimelate epimerase
VSKIHFYKYQATGNDFVLIDNRSGNYSFNNDQIKKICDRRFGVGADGLMLIEKHPSLDFNLVYYNNDGSQSLCGNGSRAAVALASKLGLTNHHTSFNAYDGGHQADLIKHDFIRLKMNDVKEVTKINYKEYFINTGSPHHLRYVTNLENYLVVEEGRKIRYSEQYAPKGTNANFVEQVDDNTIAVRTYERGVEDETLSCGTGVTAAALSAYFLGYKSPVKIKAKGGELTVEFTPVQSGPNGSNTVTFTDVYLIGPAKLVYEGDLEL